MLAVTLENITETVAPTAEPVTTAEAKSHLRVDTTADDTLIDNLVKAARQYCESYTGQVFVRRTLRADIDKFSNIIWLPGPVISVSSVKYYDTSSPSTQQTLAATVYEVWKDTVRRRFGQSWPAVYTRPDTIQITYTAGYAPTSSPEVEAENVPQAVKQAILLIVGDLYENREGVVMATVPVRNPTVNMLLDPYRRYR